jgi:uncharacterized RDD family membrane protein YckC
MAAMPERVPGVIAPRPADLTGVVRVTAAAPEGYSGLVTRGIAAAIDALLIDLAALFVAAVVALILSIFPVGRDTKTLLAVAGGVLFAIWVVGYFVTFWSTTGQTPGDRVMRLRVLREDGGTLKPLRALLRLVVAGLGLVFLLGYIPILLNDRRRAVHDWAAGTVVINQSPDTGVTVP